MKQELKCRKITVNLSPIEIDALRQSLYRGATKAQVKCANSAVQKVIDAWFNCKEAAK